MDDFNIFHVWRTKHGLNQTQAGEAIGVTQETYSRYETGKARPDYSRCGFIAKKFGVKRSVIRPDIYGVHS